MSVFLKTICPVHITPESKYLVTFPSPKRRPSRASDISQGSNPLKKSKKRLSFFGSSSEKAPLLNAETEVECIGVIKSGKGLGSVMKQFSSLTHCSHPHFAAGTYLACNKGRVAAVLQSMDAATSSGFTNKSNR